MLVRFTDKQHFCRKRLFVLINELPTVFDTVTGKKAPKGDKHDAKSNKSKNSTKVSDSLAPYTIMCSRFSGVGSNLTPSIGDGASQEGEW